MRKELMQVYVDPHQREKLEEESEKTGAAMSHIIRVAIDNYFEEGTNDR